MDAKMVGHRIKKAREAANLTQEELGNMVGIPKSNISRLEKGKHGKYVATLDKIAKALDCDLKIDLEKK